MEDYLIHYGVLGMKWGVRRYQNYDGTYTQKGLKRYNAANDEYEDARKKQKKTKQAYKDGTASKKDYTNAKNDTKLAKRKLDKSYKKLKQDKLADQGKELYRRGKTISGNTQTVAIAQSIIAAGSYGVKKILEYNGMDSYTSEKIGAAVGIGATAVNAMLGAKNTYEAKRLRAYYAH